MHLLIRKLILQAGDLGKPLQDLSTSQSLPPIPPKDVFSVAIDVATDDNAIMKRPIAAAALVITAVNPATIPIALLTNCGKSLTA